MHRLIINIIFSISLIFVITKITNAGNQQNSSNTGVVVGLIYCNSEEDLFIERSQITIKDVSCNCTANDVNVGSITCNRGAEQDRDDCTECLASLQRLGLNIINGSGFYEDSSNDEQIIYTLTGNAGPFLTRQGCFCDL